mgnify:CR=1 FL=1
MSLWEIIMVAIGLSLDAFAIAVYRGSNQCSLKRTTATFVGMIFGGIQTVILAAGMFIAIFPLLNIENEKIISINQWFSAIILFYLGIKLFKNAFKSNNLDERREEFFGYKGSIALAFATSIDAFILGISLGLLRTEVISNVLIIFIITSVLVSLGLWMGYCMGNKYKRQIDICGAVILISIGVKVIFNYFNII